MPRAPRLIDLFGSGARRAGAKSPPPPKRIAPRRGDPVPDARAIARIAEAHDSNIAKGIRMPKYQMALDAAPQDGRWLDDPNAVTTVLQFLLSKLPPDQLAELDAHLTEGTTPQATDHRLPEGEFKRKLLDYTPKNRRGMLAAVGDMRAAGHLPSGGQPRMSLDEIRRADPDAAKSFEDRFGPNATRLTR